MTGSSLALIREEFVDDLDTVRTLVKAFDDPTRASKTRIAAANSATLLLAAMFEEFVREMARTCARMVVAMARSVDELPKDLVSVAWQKSMQGLAQVRFDVGQPEREARITDTYTRFSAIHSFVKGDMTQDIYGDLIHNEHNMRPAEINSVFKVSGRSDICRLMCDRDALLNFFGETEPGKVHGRLLTAINDFIRRRNEIAHELKPGKSSGSAQIIDDIDMLMAFSAAMCETLDSPAPSSTG